MKEHADNQSENKSRAVANSLSKVQSNDEWAFQLVNDGTDVIAQKKQQDSINQSPPIQRLKSYHEMANNSPRLTQLKTYQAMADGFHSQTDQGISKDRTNNSSQTKQAFQLQALEANHTSQQQSVPSSSNSVTQLVKMVKIASYSGQEIDIDDLNVLDELIEMIEDEEEGPAIKKEIASMPLVIEAVNSRKPGLLSTGDTLENEDLIGVKIRAESDTGGWIVKEPTTIEEKLIFLNSVLGVARSIIPKAFNRSMEVGKVEEDYTNTAYFCKDSLVHAYATDCRKAGILVKNNYIHPAALERLYDIIRSTTPSGEAQLASITGVCKDFASIAYGLILQNDVSGHLNPQLAFMHGHVYVKITLEGKLYAVDAWLNGEVIPQDAHEERVSEIYSGITKAKQLDLHIGEEHQNSLDLAYEQAELARLIWYKNEGRYREIAEKCWLEGKTIHPNRGSL